VIDFVVEPNQLKRELGITIRLSPIFQEANAAATIDKQTSNFVAAKPSVNFEYLLTIDPYNLALSNCRTKNYQSRKIYLNLWT
jgi:hypothetical protein